MNQNLIRNFAIIAHIDHGKSTLADRLLEITGTVDKRHLLSQTLDSHPVSRERGITIRLAPVTMHYPLSSSTFTLNLIDTPGHVDFSYEVERSLAACEGAILLVDATQGIQAQTVSHYQKAKKLGLKIIPAINKIDAPNARIAETEKELIELFTPHGMGDAPPGPLETRESGRTHVYHISAKTGQGVKELLEAIITEVPSPSGHPQTPTRALIFSSEYDQKRGVTAFVRVVDGQIKTVPLKFLASGAVSTPFEIGHFTPKMTKATILDTGEVGYIATNLRDPSQVKVGDTITAISTLYPERAQRVEGLALSKVEGLPGYRDPKPVVFVSFFPVDQNDYPLLEDSLKKLHLNDAALVFSPSSSKALGRGYRCGFLGHLHAEITQERLAKDYNLDILATTPTVEYKITSAGDRETGPLNASESDPNSKSSGTADEHFRDGRTGRTRAYEEPWVKATIITPQLSIGPIITLCEDRRGQLQNIDYHGQNATLTYELPLAEIITDFFDALKSTSAGYASLDYELINYRSFNAVTLEIIINHQPIDAFSLTLEKSRAERYGRFLVDRLKEAIPRQQIPIPIQAAINGQIIARADIPAYRKDVTAKLYGGDSTRRLKLLEKQKKGKEKMLALSRAEGKRIGKVQIPSDTFLKIFRT